MANTSAAAKGLKRLRERTGLSVRKLAEMLDNMPASTYAAYEDKYKKKYIPIELAESLAPIFGRHGVEPGDVFKLAGVMNGRGASTAHELAESPADYSHRGSATTTDVREKGPRTVEFDGDIYAAVVRFDLYASAGPGAELPDVTEIRDRLLFKMDWLRSVTRASLEEVACLTVIGDSMESALKNGDVVLVDMTQNNPARDDIYVIRRDGLLLVKRLQKSFKTKTLTIISDNPKYGAEEGVDPNEVQVIGRVFWMGRKL